MNKLNKVVIPFLLLLQQCAAASSVNDNDKIINNEQEEEVTLFTHYTGLNTTFIASYVISKEEALKSLSKSYLITQIVHFMNQQLIQVGVPTKSLLSNDEFVVALMTVALTILVHYLIFGRKKKFLVQDLKLAQQKVLYLEEKLNLIQTNQNATTNDNPKKEIRLFMDGAFDMMHYGHMNAFRLAASLGTHLIVGVNSDTSITQCKGPPLMNDEERQAMVSGCKFVNEIVPNCPYIMNEEYLNYIIEEYDVDYIIHGDDPCIVNGKDVYQSAKKLGKFRTIPRTEGVSTTDIVGRMLLMNKDHHYNSNSNGGDDAKDNIDTTPLCQHSKFLTTSRLLRLFSETVKVPPQDGMKIIYVDGAWDMFHPGHVSILKAAKKRGDYLIVGVHGDALVNQERGCNLPLMNLHERVLSVLGCRFVDDVLIDAPQTISKAMIQSLHIDEVIHGIDVKNTENNIGQYERTIRYKHAKEAGIYVEIPMNAFNFTSILERIQSNAASFQAKIKRKKKAEEDFYSEKYDPSSETVKSSQ